MANLVTKGAERIIDNLETDDANLILSAKQGKILNESVLALESKESLSSVPQSTFIANMSKWETINSVLSQASSGQAFFKNNNDFYLYGGVETPTAIFLGSISNTAVVTDQSPTYVLPTNKTKPKLIFADGTISLLDGTTQADFLTQASISNPLVFTNIANNFPENAVGGLSDFACLKSSFNDVLLIIGFAYDSVTGHTLKVLSNNLTYWWSDDHLLSTQLKGNKFLPVFDSLYSIGGETSAYLNESSNVSINNCGSGSWLTAPGVIPVPLRDFHVVVIGSWVYFIGGVTETGVYVDSIYRAHLTTPRNIENTNWKIPYPLAFGALGVMNEQVCIYGGRTTGDVPVDSMIRTTLKHPVFAASTADNYLPQIAITENGGFTQVSSFQRIGFEPWKTDLIPFRYYDT